VQHHFIAPAAANHRRTWQVPVLAERKVAGGTVAAQLLDFEGGATLIKLVRYSITYAQEFYVRSNVDDFTDYLLAKIYS
jgi:hypothetical protein